MTKLNIAVIPGDGIGTEVMPEGIRVLEAAAQQHDLEISWQHFDWSCEFYARTGAMMPDDGIDQLRDLMPSISAPLVFRACPTMSLCGAY